MDFKLLILIVGNAMNIEKTITLEELKQLIKDDKIDVIVTKNGKTISTTKEEKLAWLSDPNNTTECLMDKNNKVCGIQINFLR